MSCEWLCIFGVVFTTIVYLLTTGFERFCIKSVKFLSSCTTPDKTVPHRIPKIVSLCTLMDGETMNSASTIHTEAAFE